jgi:hypothetical protein
MTSRRACLPALLAGLLIAGLGLEGCVATTVAGATLGVAGAAVKTTAKVTGKAAGAAVKVTAHAAGHVLAPKPPPPSQ